MLMISNGFLLHLSGSIKVSVTMLAVMHKIVPAQGPQMSAHEGLFTQMPHLAKQDRNTQYLFGLTEIKTTLCDADLVVNAARIAEEAAERFDLSG